MNSISNKDGSSILSAFGVRTGKPVPQLRELTLSAYGWNHTCVAIKGQVPELSPVDFQKVASERKLKYPSPLLTGFAKNLVDAKPGRIVARPTGGYSLVLNPKDTTLVRILAGFQAYRSQFVLREGGSAIAQDKLRGFCSAKDTAYANNSALYAVLNWEANDTDLLRAEMQTYLKYLQTALGANKTAMTEEMKRRYTNPYGWFRRFLGQNFGLDTSNMVFHGLINASAEATFRTTIAAATPVGCTAVIGPGDIRGRRPVWFCPMVHPRVGMIALGGVAGETVNGGSFYTGTAAIGYFYGAGVNGTPAISLLPGTWRCIDGSAVLADIATLNAMIGGDTAIKLGSVKDIPAGDLASLKVALGDIGDSLIPAVVAGETTSTALSTGVWRLSTSGQLRHGRFHFSYSELVNSDPGRVKLICEGMECEVPYALIRDYIRNQLDDPTLTPAQKAGIQKNLDKSTHLADAAVFVNVLRTPVTPFGLADVERLTIVQKGKKADTDMMTEEFGEDKVTLKKLGMKLQSDKDRGRQYQVVAHTVDDNMSLDDLYSPFVVTELPRAESWAFKTRIETIEGVPTVVGVDGSYAGQTYAVVDIQDAAVLCGAGATSAVTIADWNALGVTDDDLEAASSHGALGKRLVFDERRPSRDGKSIISWESLSPVEFSAWDGYPQLEYGDTDSAVRAQLVHRAMNGDTADICAMLLFTGPLDLVNKK